MQQIEQRVRIWVAVLTLAAMSVTALGTTGAAAQIADPDVQREVLVNNLISPTTVAVAPDGRAIVASREGQVTVWEQDGTVTRAAHLPVDAYDKSGGQFDESACPRGDECPAGFNLAEGGIHGILLMPDFADTGNLLLYYTVPESLGMTPWPPRQPGARPFCNGENCQVEPGESDEGLFRLSRFTLDLDTNILDVSSEVPLFDNPAEWFFCCHYGGDMEWKNDGTLLLTVGDDTVSDYSGGFSPHDQRPDWTYNSAALTSQNLADRRGKVLRIDVVDRLADGDGIPGRREGIAPNPWADDPDADPYVYAMGFRSNYRFAYNPETDHLYVGNVGPDGRYPDPTRGPAAHEELETVPPGGGSNHGWPFCIADNIPYNEYDFQTGTAGQPFDCSGFVPADIWYTYAPSPSSPYAQVLGGGNTIMGGTAYLRPGTGALRLPERYDSSLLWMEYNRGQMWRTPINADGTLDNLPTSVQPVAVGGAFILNGLDNPIDAQVGPDGAVYVVEAVDNWNSKRGILSRLKCAGCQPDAADYGGAVVPARFDGVHAPDVADVQMGTVFPGGAVALLVLLGLAWHLRRRAGEVI